MITTTIMIWVIYTLFFNKKARFKIGHRKDAVLEGAFSHDLMSVMVVREVPFFRLFFLQCIDLERRAMEKWFCFPDHGAQNIRLIGQISRPCAVADAFHDERREVGRKLVDQGSDDTRAGGRVNSTA